MNLRNNKGFTGVDISVALIIILIFIPTVFGSIYNIQRNNSIVRRETEAISIATNILEIAKGMDYSEVTGSGMMTRLSGIKRYKYINNETEQNPTKDILQYSTTGDKDQYYNIDITISNYYPDEIDDDEKKDLVKKIDVVVTYLVAQKTKTVEISTVLQNQ